MAISEARKRANNKWLNEKVENITFRVPKGKKKIIQEEEQWKMQQLFKILYMKKVIIFIHYIVFFQKSPYGFYHIQTLKAQ